MKIRVSLWILLIFVLAGLLVGCDKKDDLSPHVKPTFSRLEATDSNVGGYSAYVRPEITASYTKNQYYYWESKDFIFSKQQCVTVGYRTDSIDLSSRDDFHWVYKKGTADYCLERK